MPEMDGLEATPKAVWRLVRELARWAAWLSGRFLKKGNGTPL